MVKLYGKTYTRQELARLTPDIEHLGGVRLVTLGDGKERDVRAAQVRTGSGLGFDVLLDRGMDIGQAEYGGKPFSWQSSTGVTHPAYYEAEGLTGFLRAFHGGLVVGCGPDNVGSPNTDQGEDLGLHGRLSNIPASHVSYGGEWQGDEYKLWVQGQMRHSIVFGANLLLTRRISTTLGGNRILIEDTLENQGLDSTPYQMLYHCNFGFPLLSPEAELLVNSQVHPRDAEAKKGLASYNRFEPPQALYPEQVFYHQPKADDAGYGAATLANKALGLAVQVRFRLAELPNLIEWKMVQQGMYVLGLEPANCWVEGRATDRQNGVLRFLEPGAKAEFRLEIAVLPS